MELEKVYHTSNYAKNGNMPQSFSRYLRYDDNFSFSGAESNESDICTTNNHQPAAASQLFQPDNNALIQAKMHWDSANSHSLLTKNSHCHGVNELSETIRENKCYYSTSNANAIVTHQYCENKNGASAQGQECLQVIENKKCYIASFEVQRESQSFNNENSLDVRKKQQRTTSSCETIPPEGIETNSDDKERISSEENIEHDTENESIHSCSITDSAECIDDLNDFTKFCQEENDNTRTIHSPNAFKPKLRGENDEFSGFGQHSTDSVFLNAAFNSAGRSTELNRYSEGSLASQHLKENIKEEIFKEAVTSNHKNTDPIEEGRSASLINKQSSQLNESWSVETNSSFADTSIFNVSSSDTSRKPSSYNWNSDSILITSTSQIYNLNTPLSNTSESCFTQSMADNERIHDDDHISLCTSMSFMTAECNLAHSKGSNEQISTAKKQDKQSRNKKKKDFESEDGKKNISLKALAAQEVAKLDLSSLRPAKSWHDLPSTSRARIAAILKRCPIKNSQELPSNLEATEKSDSKLIKGMRQRLSNLSSVTQGLNQLKNFQDGHTSIQQKDNKPSQDQSSQAKSTVHAPNKKKGHKKNIDKFSFSRGRQAVKLKNEPASTHYDNLSLYSSKKSLEAWNIVRKKGTPVDKSSIKQKIQPYMKDTENSLHRTYNSLCDTLQRNLQRSQENLSGGNAWTLSTKSFKRGNSRNLGKSSVKSFNQTSSTSHFTTQVRDKESYSEKIKLKTDFSVKAPHRLEHTKQRSQTSSMNSSICHGNTDSTSISSYNSQEYIADHSNSSELSKRGLEKNLNKGGSEKTNGAASRGLLELYEQKQQAKKDGESSCDSVPDESYYISADVGKGTIKQNIEDAEYKEYQRSRAVKSYNKIQAHKFQNLEVGAQLPKSTQNEPEKKKSRTKQHLTSENRSDPQDPPAGSSVFDRLWADAIEKQCKPRQHKYSDTPKNLRSFTRGPSREKVRRSTSYDSWVGLRGKSDEAHWIWRLRSPISNESSIPEAKCLHSKLKKLPEFEDWGYPAGVNKHDALHEVVSGKSICDPREKSKHSGDIPLSDATDQFVDTSPLPSSGFLKKYAFKGMKTSVDDPKYNHSPTPLKNAANAIPVKSSYSSLQDIFDATGKQKMQAGSPIRLSRVDNKYIDINHLQGCDINSNNDTCAQHRKFQPILQHQPISIETNFRENLKDSQIENFKDGNQRIYPNNIPLAPASAETNGGQTIYSIHRNIKNPAHIWNSRIQMEHRNNDLATSGYREKTQTIPKNDLNLNGREIPHNMAALENHAYYLQRYPLLAAVPSFPLQRRSPTFKRSMSPESPSTWNESYRLRTPQWNDFWEGNKLSTVGCMRSQFYPGNSRKFDFSQSLPSSKSRQVSYRPANQTEQYQPGKKTGVNPPRRSMTGVYYPGSHPIAWDMAQVHFPQHGRNEIFNSSNDIPNRVQSSSIPNKTVLEHMYPEQDNANINGGGKRGDEANASVRKTSNIPTQHQLSHQLYLNQLHQRQPVATSLWDLAPSPQDSGRVYHIPYANSPNACKVTPIEGGEVSRKQTFPWQSSVPVQYASPNTAVQIAGSTMSTQSSTLNSNNGGGAQYTEKLPENIFYNLFSKLKPPMQIDSKTETKATKVNAENNVSQNLFFEAEKRDRSRPYDTRFSISQDLPPLPLKGAQYCTSNCNFQYTAAGNVSSNNIPGRHSVAYRSGVPELSHHAKPMSDNHQVPAFNSKNPQTSYFQHHQQAAQLPLADNLVQFPPYASLVKRDVYQNNGNMGTTSKISSVSPFTPQSKPFASTLTERAPSRQPSWTFNPSMYASGARLSGPTVHSFNF